MLWVLFALLTAFCESMKDVFSKKSLREIDVYFMAWSLRFFALPFLLPILFFIEIPVLNQAFYGALLVSGSINVLTTYLYIKAISQSDLSITVPLLTFTPLFLLITSPIIVQEFPGTYGLIGILFIVTGSYTLNLKEKNKGFLAPLRALVNENGPKLMLAVAFLWSISSNFDKVGVQNSSPLFWAIASCTYVSFFLFPLMAFKSQNNLEVLPKKVMSVLPAGFFTAFTIIFQMNAINLALVPYVISIKRTSVVMSVVFGYLFFKEKDLKQRLTGSFLMIIGVLLISLF